MTNRRMGIAGLILLMLAIGIWAVLPRHHASSKSSDTEPVAPTPEKKAPVSSASAPPRSLTASSPWTRPPAKVAAQNHRRVEFAGLKRFGASQQLIDRLADGDVAAVIHELNQRAQAGDVPAANTLEYMARLHCAFARVNGERRELQTPEMLDAQALPRKEADWIKTTIQEQNVFDQQLAAACVAIDRKQVDGWVTAAAEQGNAASLYLRSAFMDNRNPQQLQKAVDAGYPEAQARLAQSLTSGAASLPPGGESARTLFDAAATALPYAESLLAVCEFKGCPGIEADIPSAVTHAREAAQRGSFDAMIEIGPQLQASQIDPDEVAAWNSSEHFSRCKAARMAGSLCSG